MPTEKLYQTDVFCRTFTARVLSCEAASPDCWTVILDRTAFYPEGGGQPWDTGTLNDIPVESVHERDGVVEHRMRQPLTPGTTVTGVLDWTRRFDHMQQHSGEHILSGILCRLYHCDNVGFHLGAETVTIDYNTSISREQAREAERLANAVIAADRPVEITFPAPEELSRLSYRSKKALTGPVRIVTFPDADCCACCGTHVRSAGQVELVKVLSVQPFRSGVRMEIVCGGRALRLFDAVWEQNHQVAQLLSVKPTQTAQAVRNRLEELSETKQRTAALEEQLYVQTAEQFAGQKDVLLIQPPMTPDSVRRLADAIAHHCTGFAAVFAGQDNLYNYALVHADGVDIRPFVRTLNTVLHGRGGGRNGFAQGSVHASEQDIRMFWKTPYGTVSQHDPAEHPAP